MDAIEHYLRTLRVLLPAGQKDDIIRELSEELESQFAEKEAALGRALTADEQAAILRQYGHPLLIAARYRPQRHLIGPVVFPYYWLALKVTLALIVLGHLVGAGVVLAGGSSNAALGSILADTFANVLKAAGWLTALGAAFDWWLTRSRALENWKPAVPSGPRRRVLSQTSLSGIAPDPSISRFVVSVVVGVWYLAGLRYPFLFFGPDAAGLEWGPAMDRMYPILVVAQITMLAEQALRLWRPDAAGAFRVTRLLWALSGVAIVYLVATSNHQWMTSADDGRAPLVRIVNTVWSIVFVVVAVASVGGAVVGLWRRLRGRPAAAHAFVACLAALPWTLRASAPASDADIRQILVDRIDVQRRALGIVAGIVSPDGRRVVSYGTLGREDRRQVNGSTVFEIGSVTKVFTSWLLADMVGRGDVRLADKVDGKNITLADLATHCSGLPFWPSGIPIAGAESRAALARYTVEELFAFLSGFDVPVDVGTRWAYSNVDAGILAHVLARRAGSGYDVLLSTRVTEPLGMTSTLVSVTPQMESRLAAGHDAKLNTAPRWNVPAMTGSGSLHSTADDLLTFVAALVDAGSPIGAALPTMLATRRAAPGFQQALGVMVLPLGGGDEIAIHDGQTYGFASAIALDPRARTGVVVLSNAAASVGDIARHLLRPAIPLRTASARIDAPTIRAWSSARLRVP